MESYIAGGVESVLLDKLRFTPSPGASYVLNKDVVRYYPSGSSIYSPSSGQRVCKINITGAANQWINPQSLRLVFDLKETEGVHKLQPLVGAHGFWRRLDVRMGGVQVESISQMNRVQELFLMLSSDQARQKELFMGGGGLIQREDTTSPYTIKVDSLAAGKTRNMSMTIISGLTAQTNICGQTQVPLNLLLSLMTLRQISISSTVGLRINGKLRMSTLQPMLLRWIQRY